MGLVQDGNGKSRYGYGDDKPLWKERRVNLLQFPDHRAMKKENPGKNLKKSKEKDVFIVDVEEKLRNIFGTKVNISKGKKKGKIEIEYYNEEDLNNIVYMLIEDN